MLQKGAKEENGYNPYLAKLHSLISRHAEQGLLETLIALVIAEQCVKEALVADEDGDFQTTLDFAGEAEGYLAQCSAGLKRIFINYELHGQLTARIAAAIYDRRVALTRGESVREYHLGLALTQVIIRKRGSDGDVDVDDSDLAMQHFRNAMNAACYLHRGSDVLEGALSPLQHNLNDIDEGVYCGMDVEWPLNPELDVPQDVEDDIKNYDLEAAAFSGFGLLYETMGLKARARTFYIHTAHLALQAVHAAKGTKKGKKGKTFQHTEWHVRASKAIEVENARIVASERAERATRRAPTLAKLKPTLNALRVAFSRTKQGNAARDFLVFLRENHPPKRAKDITKFDALLGLKKATQKKAQKKAVLRAITYYHPDKNVGADDEWFVLCEEITTCLNDFYEVAKSKM